MVGSSAFNRWSVARFFAGVAVLLALAGWAPLAAAQTAAPVWAKAWGGVSDDALYTMATDADGNIYAGGIITSPTFEAAPGIVLNRIGLVDMLVMKTAPDGRVIWARNFGGAGVDARLMALTVNAGGDVFFTASYVDDAVDIGGQALPAPPANSMNMAVARLRADDGATEWARHFSADGGTSVIFAGRVALDPQGNPVVVADFGYGDIDVLGQTLSAGSAIQALAVAKLDGATGSRIWARASGGTGMLFTAGTGIDPAGYIYVSGYYMLGDPDFGSGALDPATDERLFLVKFDSTGAAVWARNYGGASAKTLNSTSSLAVDPGGAAYLSAVFANDGIDVGGTTLTWRAGVADTYDMLAFKVDAAGDVVWARSWGAAQASSIASSITRDTAGNIYLTGYASAGLQFGPGGPSTARIGDRDALLLRLDPGNGDVVMVNSYGGPGAIMPPTSVAVVSPSRVAIGGGFRAGPVTVGATVLQPGAGQKIFLVTLARQYPLSLSVGGMGTVTSVPAGISCGAACSAGFEIGSQVTLSAVPGAGQAFVAWAGDCVGAAPSVVVTLSQARTCAASFAAGGGGGSAPSGPAPLPPFVNAANPPPPVVSVPTGATGEGSFSLASSFTAVPGLGFALAGAGDAPLPSWLQFDPATASFRYALPLPATLPDGTAGRAMINAVFPPAILVQTVPVVLTASAGGQSHAIPIRLEFHAPRTAAAMTAISYGATGASGDAPSSRPALSWDGGQVVFQTGAGNINAAAGGYASIVRYHGLSGKRDLLSQTAVPGGGVANGADGDSTSPAVASAGNVAAFSSAAPGVSATPGNGLTQVYRTSLAYPRIALNEAATPAAVMVSANAPGIAADAPADRAAMSERGDFVAFQSAAGNLGANPGRHTQVWRKDMHTAAIVLVSSTAAGLAGDGDSGHASLSWDGRFAVFESTATNLVPGSRGRQIYLKDLGNGLIYRLSIGPGSTPRLDARATAVVYVSAGQVLHYDIATGATTIVSVNPKGLAGDGVSDQPAVSADGRFIAFRSVATDLVADYQGNGKAQIWIRDVLRGVTALVSRTAAGLPGGGDAADPALSGDGSQIAFAARARDLIRGNPLPGQIHLAGNPLVLPGRTAYWYATEGGNQSWSVERWGNKALVAGLAYRPDGGPAVWAAGECRLAGLACQGVLQQWSGHGAAANAVGLFTLTFGTDGRAARMALGGGTPRVLAPYPVGGPATSGYAGLPQAGYWGADGNAPGISSLFIDTDTQVGPDGAPVQAAHVTLFGYDTKGGAQWFAAQGAISADAFSGQLYLYGGGSSWGQGGGNTWPSATAVGTLRLNFVAPDQATAQLPDGRIVAVRRWRF